jgi:hypothetical protein
MFVAPEDVKTDPARVCILGEPGAGKTSLMGTFPDLYVIDIESGASSLKCPQLKVVPDNNAVKVVVAELDLILKSPFKDGAYEVTKTVSNGSKPITHTFRVATVGIDSIDALQQSKKQEILNGRPKLQLNDWDAMLNVMMPVVLKWSQLKCSVVVTAHTKQEEGEEGKPGIRSFSLQGAFKDQMPRWFSEILQIVAGPDGKRQLISQPQIYRGYQIKAKDRHSILVPLSKNGIMELPLINGRPTEVVAKAILEYHKNFSFR